MAIKINASAQTTYLTRDGSANPITVDDTTDWGICGWVYRDIDTGGTYEYVAMASTGVTDDAGLSMRIKNDVPGMNQTGDVDYALGGTLATGGWFFFAYSGESLFSGFEYYGTAVPLTTASGAPANVNHRLDAVIIGTYPSGAPTACLRGRIAHLRIWSGYLPTKSDFEAEMVSTTAVHTGNLWAAYEFAADESDSSGHGYNLTITGSDVSYVAGPISAAVDRPQANPMATRSTVAVHRSSSW